MNKVQLEELEIRTFRQGDEMVIAQFQEMLWTGGEEWNLAYFRWKYEQNPYLDTRLIVLAFEHEKLVGMVAGFGANWIDSNGVTQQWPCVSDTLVSPIYRTKGLFMCLLNELIELAKQNGLDRLLDFGDQPAGIAMLLNGWKSVGPWGTASLKKAFNLEGSETWIDGNFQYSTTPNLELAVMLLSNAQNPASNRHLIDKNYLTWRFANPLAKYYFLEYTHGSDKGFLVGHRTVTDQAEGNTPTTITDCAATSQLVWQQLIEKAVQSLPGREILVWLKGLSREKIDVLSSMGFCQKNITGQLTKDHVLPNLMMMKTDGLVDTDSQFVELDNWDFTGICGRSWR